MTVVVLGRAMIVYTMRGGVAAVIWTDVVQMFVYVAGALVVVLRAAVADSRRLATVVRRGRRRRDGSRCSTGPLDPQRVYTLWAGLVGGVALTLATHGTDQFLVQRLLSARSPREASRGLVLSGFIVFAQFILFLLIGVMLFALHEQTPLAAPLAAPTKFCRASSSPRCRTAPCGFIVAAIVAAALSPSLNAMAATTINDFYRPYCEPDAGPRPRCMRLSQRATVAWGVVQVGVALGAQ